MKNSTPPYFIAVMKKNNGARLKGFSRVPGSSNERVDTEKEK
jgi:hypothetical protein